MWQKEVAATYGNKFKKDYSRLYTNPPVDKSFNIFNLQMFSRELYSCFGPPSVNPLLSHINFGCLTSATGRDLA